MSDAHAEMHEAYGSISPLWATVRSTITDDDVRDCRIDEVIRWCREKLGGRDRDLVAPEKWEKAVREGWSIKATYSGGLASTPCVGRPWSSYVHDMAHSTYLMLPARFDGSRNYDNHSPGHARLELELTQLVVGWLTDESRGIKQTFPPLVLSRPA
jgi:hypothetical protein